MHVVLKCSPSASLLTKLPVTPQLACQLGVWPLDFTPPPPRPAVDPTPTVEPLRPPVGGKVAETC